MALPTRLIITNLSPTLTNPLLRQHVLQCPPQPPALTDLKILLKPDGTSRRIAFVGFRDNKEADRIRKWVDGSWVQGEKGGSRVRCDWAKETQDAPPPRKRARRSPPPTDAPEPSAKATTKSKAPIIDDSDARFQEFMSVMAPRKRTAKDVDPELGPMPNVIAPIVEPAKEKKKEVERQQEKEKEVVVVEEPEVVVVKDKIVDDDTISDMEYMQRRMKRTLEEAVEDDDGNSELGEEGDADGEGPKGDVAWTQEEEEEASRKTEESALEPPPPTSHAIETLLESHRLFIRNLSYTVTSAELTDLLEPYGAITHLHIPLATTSSDSTSTRSKGIAYATFERGQDAVRAFEELDKRSFMGRLLHVIPAVSRIGPVAGEGGGEKSVKDGIKEQRKKEANKGISWATLFMNTDAALASVADKLKIDKATLLDPTSDNAAVRVALAESHVIAETKKYFEDEGVNLESLTTPGPRSPTTILVKNLPYNTSTSTLHALFSPFGEVQRILVPPSGTMAIVEMKDRGGGEDAWRGLVFKKLGGSILYLEKGPKNLFSGDGMSKAGTSKTAISTDELKATSNANDKKEEEEAASTLFVKNLSFATSTTSLTSAFSNFPSFLFARVQQKPDPKKPGGQLSMGFGFVGFRDVQGAQVAMKERNGYLLEGHVLEVKFAMRGRERDGGDSKGGKRESGKKAKKNETSTKLIVKNLPFEITRKEVRELFSSYGQLKSVRLPRKFDHKTRGFAFLDFLTRRDAESALSALEHSHLLGRHMVIQWADDEPEEGYVEELRKKVGRDLPAVGMGQVGGRKKKFALGGDGEDGRNGAVEVMDED